MSTSSSPTAPSSISLVSGLHCGGVYETRSKHHDYDSVRISMLVSTNDDSTFQRHARIINEIKESYATCRLLYFEALGEDDRSSDDMTLYADLGDDAVYCVSVGKLKLANESALNVLDKVALFLNLYLGLGVKETVVSFMNIWTEKEDGKERLRRSIVDRQIYSLFAIYDLYRDLERGGILSSVRYRRHVSTHRYLVTHDGPEKGWRIDLDGPEYHVSSAKFAQETLELLQSVRACIIYLVALVNREEEIKRKNVICTESVFPQYQSKKPRFE